MPGQVLHIATGGTIDKAYPRSIGGKNSLKTEGLETIELFAKDSQEITAEDREELLTCINDNVEIKKFLITHGTDTIIETALFLQERLSTSSATVVLTGAFLPEAFRLSDADFNVGFALGVLSIAQPGVYVAIQGICGLADRIRRNPETTRFELIP